MLGKLIKYEFNANSRTFLPMYIALILVAAVNRISRVNMGEANLAFGISIMVLVGLFMALGVVTLVVIIQRFNKNLLGDEGYLMFTLPVKVSELIFSKLIVSFFWNVISAFVSFITFMVLLGDEIPFKEIFTNFGELWREFTKVSLAQLNMHPIQFILLMLITTILGYTAFIFQVYLSLSTAQLPIFNKHRGIIAFVAFFVINVLLSIGAGVLGMIVPNSLLNTLEKVFGYMIITSLVVCLIEYVGMKYILEKHLNLE